MKKNIARWFIHVQLRWCISCRRSCSRCIRFTAINVTWSEGEVIDFFVPLKAFQHINRPVVVIFLSLNVYILVEHTMIAQIFDDFRCFFQRWINLIDAKAKLLKVFPRTKREWWKRWKSSHVDSFAISALAWIQTDIPTFAFLFTLLSTNTLVWGSSGFKKHVQKARFFLLIFIAHEIINFQLLLTYKILKTFMLLFMTVHTILSCSCSHSFTLALPVMHAASNVQAEATKRNKHTNCQKTETKNNFSLHVRSKMHLGLKRIIGHH